MDPMEVVDITLPIVQLLIIQHHIIQLLIMLHIMPHPNHDQHPDQLLDPPHTMLLHPIMPPHPTMHLPHIMLQPPTMPLHHIMLPPTMHPRHTMHHFRIMPHLIMLLYFTMLLLIMRPHPIMEDYYLNFLDILIIIFLYSVLRLLLMFIQKLRLIHHILRLNIHMIIIMMNNIMNMKKNLLVKV